jgi:hypothetical protein
MLLLLLACSDYAIHPVADVADPVGYQTAVLDFMCSATCAWEDESACWAELESHWGFCLTGEEILDAATAEACLALMDEARLTGECTWLPAECMVAAVAISSRAEGEDCYGR